LRSQGWLLAAGSEGSYQMLGSISVIGWGIEKKGEKGRTEGTKIGLKLQK